MSNLAVTDNEKEKINQDNPTNLIFTIGNKLQNALNAGKTFKKTAILTSAAATTAQTLLTDLETEGGTVYITNIIAKVNGGTAWSGGTFSKAVIQDNAGSPVEQASIAVAGLTGNALLFPSTANVTIGAGISLQSGATAGKGISLVGDNAAGAGSDLYVTIVGYIA